MLQPRSSRAKRLPRGCQEASFFLSGYRHRLRAKPLPEYPIAPAPKARGFSAADVSTHEESNSTPRLTPRSDRAKPSHAALTRTESHLSRSGEPTAHRPQDAAPLAQRARVDNTRGWARPPPYTDEWLSGAHAAAGTLLRADRSPRGCICLTAHIRLPRSQ
jgi:hypothetical protein